MPSDMTGKSPNSPLPLMLSPKSLMRNTSSGSAAEKLMRRLKLTSRKMMMKWMRWYSFMRIFHIQLWVNVSNLKICRFFVNSEKVLDFHGIYDITPA